MVLLPPKAKFMGEPGKEEGGDDRKGLRISIYSRGEKGQ